MTRSRPIPPARVEAFTAIVDGVVLQPGDAGFDAARAVWNGRFNRKPDLIVRCAGTDDVVASVNFAREERHSLSVKGGGHDYAGNTVGEGGILIDLSPMRGITVDPEGRRAVVEAGATWADVDATTQAHGLVTPGGTVSSVGVAGFTLGGGGGWLTRKFGMAVDNLLAAEVVTADGEVIRASEEKNPDLFWALRGGGGNFGVVTRFEYRLHEFGPRIQAGQVIYPLERAGELLRWYRDYMKEAPDEIGVYPFFIRIPPLPAFPSEIHGKVVVDFVVAYAGPVADGETHLRRFQEHDGAIMDTVAPIPYVSLQQAFDAGMGKGNRWYSRYLHLREVSDDFIDTLLENLDPFPGAFTAVYLGAQGGAAGRVSPDATAYPHRDIVDALHIFPGWSHPEDDDAIMTWARGLYGKLEPFGEGGVYVNMLGDDEEGRLRAAYGTNYSRLVQLKRKWDPDNLFRMNHNIPPEG